MSTLPSFRKVALTLTLTLTLAFALCARSLAATLPRLEADSLGGKHVVLPKDAAGRPLVLLIGFSKDSEGDLKSLSRKLLDSSVATKAALYVVVVADNTAPFARGIVRRVVERAAVGSAEQKNNNVLLTFNGAGWRDVVPPGDKKTVGVVVCKANGSIVYAKRQPYNDAQVRDIEKAAK